MTRREKTKAAPLSLHNKHLVNLDLDHCLQTANQMPMENLPILKFQLTLPTSRICYRSGKGKHPIDQKCSAIDATCNKCGKKEHYAVICQKGERHSHSSKFAHIAETTNSISTEPDYYMECR